MVLRAKETFGVATARYLASLPLDDHPLVVDVPLGSFIVRWDMQTQTRLNTIHCNGDLITCLIRNPKLPLACTITHMGKVTIWEYPSFNQVSFAQLSVEKLSHASFSSDGRTLVGSSLFKGGRISIMNLDERGNIQSIKEITGKYECTFISPNGNVFAVEVEKTKESIDIFSFDPSSGELLKRVTLPGRGLTCSATNHNGLVALAKMNHEIYVVDTDTLEVKYVLRNCSKIYIKSIIFEGEDELWFAIKGGEIVHYKGTELVEKFSVPNCVPFFLGWSIRHKRVWIVDESGITNTVLLADPSSEGTKDGLDSVYTLKFHDVTCCGVDHHEDLICAGDFMGNLLLWKKGSIAPIASALLNSGVRTVAWKYDGSSIQIGCLDGQIWEWKPFESEGGLKQLFLLLEGVTCLKWDTSPHRSIAATTTDGSLAIFTEKPGESNLAINMVIKAHKPIEGPQDLRFGSIQKFAEIWSCAWSPDNTMIATSSEDQTTKIWNRWGELIDTLTGHTAAVTSVDWAYTSVGEILATCADDNTVRIYKAGKSFELIHVFHTVEVEEWHTITYLAIEQGGNRVAIATQSGYIFVWSLESKEKLFGEKMHAGSVEGLRWNHKTELLVSCSSDCTVNVYEFHPTKGISNPDS